MKAKLTLIGIFMFSLAGCEAAPYVLAGAGQIATINDYADAYEEQQIADLCAENPTAFFCPEGCELEPEQLGCPGYSSSAGFCNMFPDAETCIGG